MDIKPENELFERGKLTGVVDFGNFYVDAFVIDVGKTIMWNCCRNRKLDWKLALAFMEGYTSRRKASRAELASITQWILFAIYSHLWVDLYPVPLGYVPESYTLRLVNEFLPIARQLESEN